jgi:pimeloyl-ACP methyl ester carboxylesterase
VIAFGPLLFNLIRPLLTASSDPVHPRAFPFPKMSYAWCALALLFTLINVVHASNYPPCVKGLTCTTLSFHARFNLHLTFNCAFIKSTLPTTKGQVYFMHGNDGKQSKGMFFNMMLRLAALGYNGLSCDARGYSPGASPPQYNAYNYNELTSDIFSLLDASGYSTQFNGTFHLVTHDQGARVSWHAIASHPEIRTRLLSFTSLSIPHSDVFSNALIGPNMNTAQASASQYVRMLVLPNSTDVDSNRIYNIVCKSEQWLDSNQCQRTLWWYNGAIDSGAMALAPLMNQTGAAKYVGIPQAMVKQLTQYPLEGVPQTVKVGKITQFPVLYACGTDDTSDLCNPIFGTQSQELIQSFTYLQLPGCGHDVLGCGVPVQKELLESAIVKHIQDAKVR